MSAFDPTKVPEGTRIIKTGRTEEEINEGIRQGFRALVIQIIPSPRLKTKRAVFQNKETGEIEISADFRSEYNKEEWTKIKDWVFYYPYHWPEPFAAYLLPPDLEVGDTVWLEDLIEDEVGTVWNQGDTNRLPSCLAVWNGEEFDLLFDRNKDRGVIYG